MGNFYVNHAVRDADPRRVADVLARAGRQAIVTPSRGGYTAACDAGADTQSETEITAVGRLLSRELGRPVLAVLNHDDDILCYWLFEAGEVADEYNSDPDYFGDGGDEPRAQGGDAAKLVAALNPAAEPAAVEAALRDESAFAVERHAALAELLGLPDLTVGLGYNYANQEGVRGVPAGELLRVEPPES